MPNVPVAVFSPVLVRVLRVVEVDLDSLGSIQHVVELGGILLVVAVMTGNLGDLDKGCQPYSLARYRPVE